MAEHAVVIAGAGPTGLMLAGELALAGSMSRSRNGAPATASSARAPAV
jgi:NADH dehydrogenase FAD-containing subunit